MFFLAGPSIVMLLLGVAVGAGGATLFFLLTRKKEKGEAAPRTDPMLTGLRENADRFTGMYEPMFSICVGKHQKQADVFAAWNGRVNECEDEAFKAVFATKFGDYGDWGVKGKKRKLKQKKADKIYAKKAGKLVRYFTKAGILREVETFIEGKEGDGALYELAGGGEVQPGVTYEVLAPYWHFGDTVLDKGAVR